jgi:hypothetical protein
MDNLWLDFLGSKAGANKIFIYSTLCGACGSDLKIFICPYFFTIFTLKCQYLLNKCEVFIERSRRTIQSEIHSFYLPHCKNILKFIYNNILIRIDGT